MQIEDDFYRAAASRYTIEELREAWYLDVRRQKDSDVDSDITPLDKIKGNLEAGAPDQMTRPLYVLLSSGCYNPVHDGHIKILEYARSAMEMADMSVLGGYMSPCHAMYADGKVRDEIGTVRLDTEQRVSGVRERLNRHPWLDVDPYDAIIESDNLNVSDVMTRLEAYLRKYVSSAIQVVYVFGGDNAAIARAFWKIGRGVCVHREGHEKIFDKIRDEFEGNHNVIFVKPKIGEETGWGKLNSTALRRQSK